MEKVALSMTMDDSIKRWTAKRKTALVIELIQGRTTVAEASRSFDLTPSEIEGWQVRKRAIGIRPRIQAVPSVATAPNERWSTDLARVWTGKDGWASLALVIDCHTRELLGWHLSRSGKATTASAALEHALTRNRTRLDGSIMMTTARSPAQSRQSAWLS